MTNSTDTPKQYDWYICCPTGNNLVNTLPLEDNTLHFNQVLILTTEKMVEDGVVNSFTEFLKTNHKKYTCIPIEESLNYLSMSKKIEEFIYTIKVEDNQTALINITGGTKLITLALFIAAKETDTPCIYLDLGSRKSINIFEPDIVTQQSNNKLSLKKYLNIHLYNIDRIEKFKNVPEFTDYCQWLIKSTDTVKNDIGALNQWTDHLSKTNQSMGIFDEPNHIIEYCEAVGLMFKNARKELGFKNYATQKFIQSQWIEYFTAYTVDALYKKGLIDDYAVNLTITSKDNIPNELDCVVLKNNVLYIIECKTQNMAAEQGKAAQNTIYKLDSILSNISTLNAKGMIVSFRKIDDRHIKRANEKNIKTVHQNQINQLDNHLLKLINA